MTYKEFIAQVGDEVLEQEYWPDPDTQTEPTEYQLRLSYRAGLAAGSLMRTGEFSSYSTGTPGSPTTITGNLERYQLPSDVYALRQDLGIVNLILDGENYTLRQMLPYHVILTSAKNDYQKDVPLFHLDFKTRKLYVNNVSSPQVEYVQEPQKPDLSNAFSTDYPIDGVHAKRAVHAVASHVSGVKRRDMTAAQFQQLLRQDVMTQPQQQANE